MSNQMLNATDPSCGCSKSTPSSPCNGGCGGPKPTACSPCVPSCHEQVNTYAELTANKSLFAGKYVSVIEEEGIKLQEAAMLENKEENEKAAKELEKQIAKELAKVKKAK